MSAQISANKVESSAAMESSKWDLVLTRVFDAPREMVFKAWTETQQVAQWWGPKGFTNPVCEMEVRVGGAIRIHMRAPDGMVYPMTGVFQEIATAERLVFISSALDDKGNSMFDILTTVIFAELFSEQREKTAVTLQARVVKATAQAPQYLKGMEAGWTQSFDRLLSYLESSKAGTTMHLARDASDTADREIATTRVFDAPRELVWKMWTDPVHLAQWWGPVGFTTTVQEMNVRTGGEWRLVMRGPDGRDYRNRIIYREVKEPERLVYEHSPEKGSEPVSFCTTVTFAARGEKTEVGVTMLFPTAKAREHVAKTYRAVEGLASTLGRLEGMLAKMSGAGSSEEEFAITRVFDAPREMVFKAWTEPERLARWWGPKNFTVEASTMDLRPGGSYHYSMRASNGQVMWGKFAYREIVAPERIVFVNCFSDEQGGITRNPWMPMWPLEILNTLTMTEHEGKTTLSIRGGPINATEAERKAFLGARQSMQAGFGGTFDQLAEYLAKA